MGISSVLKMEKLYFEKIELSRQILENGIEDYCFNFTRSISEIDSEHFIVSLLCNITSEDEKSLKLSTKITGWFECTSEDDEEKRILIQQNAIAIMFPYLRSQIILITTQPDMTPIQLPIINITELFNGSENSQE